MARGEIEREVKEATQAVSTSGQTFSREQLDTSNQVREGEAATSSRWEFSSSTCTNCTFETLVNLRMETLIHNDSSLTELLLPLGLKDRCYFLQSPLIDVQPAE